MSFIESSDTSRKVRQFFFGLAIFTILSFQTVQARDDDYSDFSGYDSNTEDRYQLDISNSQKDYIVKLHNELRNKVALGQIGKLGSAAKMPALKWSNELAHLARVDSRSCVFGNDECHSTDKYRNGGQIIARHGITGTYDVPPMHAATSIIMNWFLEYKDADMSNINSNNHPQGYEPNKREFTDFTVMMNDRYASVGCAIIRNKEDGLKYYFMLCNYGYTATGNRRPIYEKGSSTSRCRDQHPDYEGLCRNSGSIVENRRLLTVFF